MTQNPPFPSPEELKAKLSEFMKTNFGDKVAFTTYTEPDAAQAPAEEKPSRPGPRHCGQSFDSAPHAREATMLNVRSLQFIHSVYSFMRRLNQPDHSQRSGKIRSAWRPSHRATA